MLEQALNEIKIKADSLVLGLVEEVLTSTMNYEESLKLIDDLRWKHSDRTSLLILDKAREKIINTALSAKLKVEKEDSSVLYFYKLDGENIPIITTLTNQRSVDLLLEKAFIEKVEKDYPVTKNNLYALLDGTEFKLNA